MSGSDMPYIGRRGRAGSPTELRRRTFAPGLLAVVSITQTETLIDLSTAVAPGNVAAAKRHLDEVHPIAHGATACYVPCPGALALLPPETDEPSRRPAIAHSG